MEVLTESHESHQGMNIGSPNLGRGINLCCGTNVFILLFNNLTNFFKGCGNAILNPVKNI